MADKTKVAKPRDQQRGLEAQAQPLKVFFTELNYIEKRN
jgi:hypothetical protein